jgi:hypothetical protein
VFILFFWVVYVKIFIVVFWVVCISLKTKGKVQGHKWRQRRHRRSTEGGTYRRFALPLSDDRLDEVDLQVSLEVEVGEDLILVDLEQLGQLGIRVDLSAALLVL